MEINGITLAWSWVPEPCIQLPVRFPLLNASKQIVDLPWWLQSTHLNLLLSWVSHLNKWSSNHVSSILTHHQAYWFYLSPQKIPNLPTCLPLCCPTESTPQLSLIWTTPTPLDASTLFCFLAFCLYCAACGMVPWPGIECRASAVKPPNPNQ